MQLWWSILDIYLCSEALHFILMQEEKLIDEILHIWARR